MLRKIARSTALRIPPVRRFYDFAIAANSERARLQAEHHQLLTNRAHLLAERDQLRAERDQLAAQLDQRTNELALAVAKPTQDELELYLLRSDFNRTVDLCDRTRKSLAVSQKELADAHRALREFRSGDNARRFEELEARHTHLLSHLSIMGAELKDVRRLSIGPGAPDGHQLRLLYLDLLENALTGLLFQDPPFSPWSKGYDPNVRVAGRDWPENAQTMIGAARMRNVRSLAERILDERIAGDFLEAGVWRGGACIYMRGILAAYGDLERTVWAADSFEGLPPPNPDAYPADDGDLHHTLQQLAVPLEEVRSNFSRFGLLDRQVRFLPGWFKDTLHAAPIEKLALLRLDGDMYQSTMETLEPLYPKLSPGGYVIVDDYLLPPCQAAVNDFRQRHHITEPIEQIDGAGIFWRKERQH